MLTRPIQPRQKVRVGELLLQRGLITQAQLQQALREQKNKKEKLGVILERQGLVTHHQLQNALQAQTWHNTIATVLIAASTLVSHAPKLAMSGPVAPVQTLQPNASDSIGGPTEDNKTPTAHTSSEVNTIATRRDSPLHANPTVASPLEGFCHPLNGLGWLSQGNNGVTHQGRMKYAYDLAAPIGTPVYAMRSGRVIGLQDRYPDTGGSRAQASKFNYVFIKHDGGYRSIYVHLQQNFRQAINLKAGDWVDAGDLIGYSGNSGWSTGPHLHIEVQKPGESLRKFSGTVPFAVKGRCTQQVAQN